MKNMPEVGLSFEPLIHILGGSIPAKLLLTAIELRVFSHLTEAMSADFIRCFFDILRISLPILFMV